MLKALLLDLDGTIYYGNRVIRGVPAILKQLRKKYRIFFVSNASMKTRAEQTEKLKKMGIDCTRGEVYNTAYATASYIKKHYSSARVYVISEGGLKKEIEKRGIKTTHRTDATLVATGLDTNLTFEKLVIGFQALMNGAVFIASNVDRRYPVEKGILPGSGTIAAFLEYGTGKKPIIIGKPYTYLITAVLKENNLKPGEVLIVGDNYETDIRVAERLGIKSALVLSGITKQYELKKLKRKPDFILNSVLDLPKLVLNNIF